MPDIGELSQDPGILGSWMRMVGIVQQDPGIAEPDAKPVEGVAAIDHIGTQVEVKEVRYGVGGVFLVTRHQAYGRADLKKKMAGFQESPVIPEKKEAFIAQ